MNQKPILEDGIQTQKRKETLSQKSFLSKYKAKKHKDTERGATGYN